MVDLEAPLTDLDLWRPGSREPYRSLMVVARLDGAPLGVATFSVGPRGKVSCGRLAYGLRRQLETELGEAFARRDLALPQSLPFSGTPHVKDRPRTASTKQRLVSVVVATCCKPDALERCLRSIFLCDYRNFEVIVVENRPGSSATRGMLAKHFPQETNLRYVEETHAGASRARNAGLALARGEIIEAMERVILKLPDAQLDPSQPAPKYLGHMPRSFRPLNVKFTPRTAV